MTSSNEVANHTRKRAELSSQRGSADSIHHSLPGEFDPARVIELEKENNRLQLLVAELLIKNQQLRKDD